jgi:hypothetical protein
MTDSEDTKPSDPTAVELVNDVSGDGLLSALARLAQESELGISLTVHVAGTIYSGVTVGRSRWFSLVAEQASNIGAAAGQVVGQIRDGVAAMDAEHDNDDEPIYYGYLHMHSVTVVSGGTVVGPANGLWRVRISEISAWMIGSYS